MKRKTRQKKRSSRLKSEKKKKKEADTERQRDREMSGKATILTRRLVFLLLMNIKEKEKFSLEEYEHRQLPMILLYFL